MKYSKDIAWAEVFDHWRERESHNPGWIKCATEIKGWPDWESWRGFTANQMKADKRAWQLFEFTDPEKEVPMMLLGPYSGWQSRVADKNSATFLDLMKIPEQFEFFSKHDGVKKILEGLPFETEFIGLRRVDGKIVCMEGHHRATAVTIALMQGKNIDYSKTRITIALADLQADETTLPDEMLERGTSKED